MIHAPKMNWIAVAGYRRIGIEFQSFRCDRIHLARNRACGPEAVRSIVAASIRTHSGPTWNDRTTQRDDEWRTAGHGCYLGL